MPAETNHEVQLSKLLAALSNPAVRHFIELLALERRPSVEVRMHFDLTVNDIRLLGRELAEVGLVSQKYHSDYVFEEAGLTPIQEWLDRIRSLKK
jgi:hypothetical protein